MTYFNYLFNSNETKIPLRRISEGLVDSTIVNDIIKKGFPTPVHDWIQNEFDEISFLLKNGNLIKNGFFSQDQMIKILKSYSKNKKKNMSLWRILSAEIWFIHYENKFNSPL